HTWFLKNHLHTSQTSAISFFSSRLLSVHDQQPPARLPGWSLNSKRSDHPLALQQLSRVSAPRSIDDPDQRLTVTLR
ncbi:MAG: hypothetical protein AB8E74_07165, partial [Prochlorococcus sp.]